VWAGSPGFSTLVNIILEQQVSLASARATFDKLRQRVTRLSPRSFLELDGRTLKACGFSRQKTEYCRHLAHSVLDRRLVFKQLETADDSTARAELVKIKGIGPWSADIYLLMVHLRPDVWPSGDLALASAVRQVKGLTSLPSSDEVDRIGLQWRPWRAVAARILWHHYLKADPVDR
jgi:DNA-3-methyladenine glycosylase II